MSDVSRQLAADLSAGEHRLTNADLRRHYGLTRVTEQSRARIADELHRAGLQIVSDARAAPLVVRKPRGTAPTTSKVGRSWPKRRWALGLAAVLLVVLLVAGVASENSSGPAADDASSAATAEAAVQTETTPSAAAPVATRAQALAMVEDDHYVAAAAAASALTDNDNAYVRSRIANRVARRVIAAVRRGDRSQARRLLSTADGFPSTDLVVRARSDYRAAKARALARAKAKSLARAKARERARAAAAARRAAKRAAAAARRAAEQAAAAPEVAAPATSGPSTTNWCGKRDGDGDGIYCEGE